MYKRPSIDEDTYYKIMKIAAEQKTTVKVWLMEAINEKLEREYAKSAQDTIKSNS